MIFWLIGWFVSFLVMVSVVSRDILVLFLVVTIGLVSCRDRWCRFFSLPLVSFGSLVVGVGSYCDRWCLSYRGCLCRFLSWSFVSFLVVTVGVVSCRDRRCRFLS